MFVSSCQSVDMTIDIVKHEEGSFHVVASTLSLPRCCFHVVASEWSLPRCRFHVIASKLSQERERHGSHVHKASVLARAFFSEYVRDTLSDSAVMRSRTGTSSLSALDPLPGQEKWRRLAGGRFGFIALYL